MALIFVVENGVAKPTTEALLIYPYKDIWERDTSADKSIAIAEFCFIEFMMSKKKSNPYAGYDNDVRFEKLRDAYFDEDWEPDDLVQKGMAELHEFQTNASATYSYFIAMEEIAHKLKKFMREVDLDERNDRGGLMWKPKDITSAMTDTDRILQNMNSMRDKVEQELFESAKTKGNRTTNYFEE